jgi:hypothetical protein
MGLPVDCETGYENEEEGCGKGLRLVGLIEFYTASQHIMNITALRKRKRANRAVCAFSFIGCKAARIAPEGRASYGHRCAAWHRCAAFTVQCAYAYCTL